MNFDNLEVIYYQNHTEACMHGCSFILNRCKKNELTFYVDATFSICATWALSAEFRSYF